MPSRGPGHDAGQFREAVGAAAARVRIDTLPGDAAFDGEPQQAYTRGDFGIRSAAFPVFRRGGGDGRVRGAYRDQMVRRFRPKPAGGRHRRVCGQRWQAESAFSRHKGVLGGALRARLWGDRVGRVILRAVVHNLMLLAP